MTRKPASPATRTSSTNSVKATGASTGTATSAVPVSDGVQGEGNYAAAREFNAAERKFVASGKVAKAAQAAAPQSETERLAMLAAEEAGRQRAKK